MPVLHVHSCCLLGHGALLGLRSILRDQPMGYSIGSVFFVSDSGPALLAVQVRLGTARPDPASRPKHACVVYSVEYPVYICSTEHGTWVHNLYFPSPHPSQEPRLRAS